MSEKAGDDIQATVLRMGHSPSGKEERKAFQEDGMLCAKVLEQKGVRHIQGSQGRCGWSENWCLYEMGLESGQGQTHGVCGQVTEHDLDRGVL